MQPLFQPCYWEAKAGTIKTKLSSLGLKRWLYTRVIRHRMNAQVRRIRAEKW